METSRRCAPRVPREPSPTSRSPTTVQHAILDDARFAPSGGNRQPWRVAVVEDLTIRRRMAELMQPVWDGYVAGTALGITPFNSVDDREPTELRHAPNPLLDSIESVPVVLAVAADLRRIALMDGRILVGSSLRIVVVVGNGFRLFQHVSFVRPV